MMDALLNNIIWFVGNSLFIIGLWGLCKEGMLLGFVIYKRWEKFHLKTFSFYTCNGWWSIDDLPEWIKKPLYSCPPCMASVWGFAGFMLNDWSIEWVIPYMVMLSGLNAIIVNYINFD